MNHSWSPRAASRFVGDLVQSFFRVQLRDLRTPPAKDQLAMENNQGGDTFDCWGLWKTAIYMYIYIYESN